MVAARDLLRADTSPSFEPPQWLRDSRFLSAWPSRTPRRVRDSASVPAWRLPPEHAEYACCAVWRAVSATVYLLNALFVSAQSAIADGLLHRVEAGYIADLERPGKRGDRSYAGNGPEVL